jgi:hypothetical protein
MPRGVPNRLQKVHFYVQLAFHPALSGFLSRLADGSVEGSRWPYLSI